MNLKKWTERSGNLWQWIKNCTKEVMLFLGKMVEEGLLNENSVKRRKSLSRYVKNSIEPLLAAVRTNRILTHVDTVDSTEFKKIKEEQRKHEWTEKRMLV